MLSRPVAKILDTRVFDGHDHDGRPVYRGVSDRAVNRTVRFPVGATSPTIERKIVFSMPAMTVRITSAVFAMSATSPFYLQIRKDCGIVASQR